MKSGNNSGEIPRPFQPAEPLTPVTTVSVEREGALEKQFIINFDRRCTILLSEEERDALYSSLGDYRATRQLNPLLDRLSQILNSPIKMELVDDIKHFIEERHLVQFEKGMPFGDLGAKVVKILNSTPSYDVRQRSAATTPRSLTPYPMGDWDRRSSKDETGESKRFELTKVDKQQLGFTLWGASDGQGGIFIKHIMPQSIADTAGLKPGDRLLDINDTPLDSFSLAQVANLIEKSGVLRMHVQRNRASQRLYATPQNLLLREERARGEERTAIPLKFDPRDKRTPNPFITVSSPSSKTFPEVVKGGTRKEGLFGGRTYDLHPPRSRTGTMSSVVSKTRQIPIKTSGHRPPNSDSLDNVTTEKYESLSSFPNRRTKTVIDLNSKAVENYSSIRIEEMANVEDNDDIAGTQRTPIPLPRSVSSTLPRSAQSTPFTVQHQKSTSLQMLPNPHTYNYQSSALSSPVFGRSTKVIPIIRSYIPQDSILDDKKRTTTLQKYAPNRPQNQQQQQQNLSGIQIEQPQLNLVPPQYEQLFQQIQRPRMQNAELYSSVQRFPPHPYPRSRSHHSNENIIHHERYSQKPQYVHHRRDTKRSLSTTPVPPERYPDPVFPTVIPHYHAIPRRSEDHPYLESDFPHPGMWKSMDDIPYGSLNQKLSPKRNRSKRYLSNPDLSSWSRYGRVYYERGSPTPSDLDEYSERSRDYRYNRPFPSGWRSDHDVEYGTTRPHYRRGNKYWNYPDRRLEYFDAAQAQFYEDRLRSLREPESLDRWDDTESEYSDFETVSTAFDSSIERQRNRKYRDRPSGWQNYGQFLEVPNTSRSKGSNVYLSNASQEVLFKKGASTDSDKFRVPIRVDDITSSYLDDEIETSPRSRRSKYDRLDNSSRNIKASPRKPSRNLTGKSSNAFDHEAKATYVKSKEAQNIRSSKSISKSPRAQPRYHSKTPSMSSLSSNFSQTASTEIPLFNSISATNDESRKANEEEKPSHLTNQRHSEKRSQIDEMSEDEMNAISLLGYSKLSSPGASLRLKSPSAQNHVYQNVHFNREPTFPRQIDARLASSSLIRSDSQSSVTSVRTTKSGHYDFVDATTEFNKSQPQSKNVDYTEKRPTIQPSEVTSARERIFGKGWQAAQIRPVPETVAKNESSIHNKMKQDDSWIKHGDDNDAINPVEQPETRPVVESKLKKDDPKANEANSSKWSLKDDNRTEKGWSENVLNDGRYKSIAIDSADSGVSVETNTISSPLKSPTNPPALYPKPVANQSYAIYQNQNFLSRTSGESADKKIHLNQSNSQQISGGKVNTNTPPGDAFQRHSEIKWRPMAKQRTFDERQKSLVAAENYKRPHNLIQAKLDKTCPYLGLSISGGMESRTCPDVIIDNITRGSAADIEGSLKPGMKLTSVDGQSLVNVTHGEAVRIIKTSFLDKTKRWMDVEAVN